MAAAPVPDAQPGNWADRLAPKADGRTCGLPGRPADRTMVLPVSMLVVAGLADVAWAPLPEPWLLTLFAVGAIVMRGAGCAYNDIVDRDYEPGPRALRAGLFRRARSRPRRLGVRAVCSFVGLIVLIQFNTYTIMLGMASSPRAVYPFRSASPIGRSSCSASPSTGARSSAGAGRDRSASPLLLYAGSVLWTMGYDTIYAHQDRETDLLLGSSRLRPLRRDTMTWVGGSSGVRCMLWRSRVSLPAPTSSFSAVVLGRPANGVAGDVARRLRSRELPAAVSRQPGRGAVMFLGLVADMASRPLAVRRPLTEGARN